MLCELFRLLLVSSLLTHATTLRLRRLAENDVSPGSNSSGFLNSIHQEAITPTEPGQIGINPVTAYLGPESQ